MINQDLYKNGVLEIDFLRHRVQLLNGMREIKLSATEFRLLTVLVQNKGIVLSVDRLLELVWGDRDVTSDIVRVYISFLRRKLNSASLELIETVQGFGYRYK